MIKKEGPGWRIIRDLSRDNFSTLIGGESWAIELNQSEWATFAKVVFDLSDQYEKVKDQLMGDEDITLELESNPWFGILQGDKHGWNLKLVLGSCNSLSRGAEVYWPRSVTFHLAKAMRTMWDSDYL